jgi:hypothetical protein
VIGDVFPDNDTGPVRGVMQYELDRMVEFVRDGGQAGRHIKDIRIKMADSWTADSVLKVAKLRGLIENVPACDVPKGKGRRRYRVVDFKA